MAGPVSASDVLAWLLGGYAGSWAGLTGPPVIARESSKKPVALWFSDPSKTPMVRGGFLGWWRLQRYASFGGLSKNWLSDGAESLGWLSELAKNKFEGLRDSNKTVVFTAWMRTWNQLVSW